MNTTPTVTSTASTTASAAIKPPPFKISTPGPSPKFFRGLFYGAPGVGKTTLAGSYADVADNSRIFYINAESGEMAFNDNDRIKHPERIFEVRLSRFRMIADIHSYLMSFVKLREANNIPKLIEYEAWVRGMDAVDISEPTIFTTVVIDTITELELYCMNHLLGVHEQFEGINIDPDMKTAEFAEYKKNNNMMNTIVRLFRDLPFNLIVLAHEKWEKDEQQRFHYMPRMTGQLRDQVQGYFDIVGRLVTGAPIAEEQGRIPRRLYVQPVGKWDAKCRRASFKGTHFDEPTMTTILDGLGMRSNVMPNKE